MIAGGILIADLHLTFDTIVRHSFSNSFQKSAMDPQVFKIILRVFLEVFKDIDLNVHIATLVRPGSLFAAMTDLKDRNRQRCHFQEPSREMDTCSGNLLTMGLIGCLPDNVQQSIKSFSIRPGRQHVTFAFPFMEEALKSFSLEPGSGVMTSGVFFDDCLEVVHGFKTFVTLVPISGRTCLPVVQLTMYQRNTEEGIIRHFQSHFRITVEKRPVATLWTLPLLVTELSPSLREKVLDSCADVITELHGEQLGQMFPLKSAEEITSLIKDSMVRPCFMSYRILLRKNIEEVMGQLTATDPAYFVSVLDLLQAPGGSHLDLKKVDFMFKSPSTESIVQSFWKVWGQEAIARRVFCPSYNPDEVGGSPGCPVGPLSRVPLKEGLQSVIKSLKSQESSFQRISESRKNSANVERSSGNVGNISAVTKSSAQNCSMSKGYVEKSAFHPTCRTIGGGRRSRRHQVNQSATCSDPYQPTRNFREWTQASLQQHQRRVVHPRPHYGGPLNFRLPGHVM